MTRLSYPSLPLHDVMRVTAARVPDKTAITFKGRSLSFAAFDLESNRLANALRALGVATGDRIGLYLPNGPEYELGFYAASKLGAVASPMNPSYREREITYQVNDSGATVLLTHSSLWPVIDECRPNVPRLRRVIVVGDDVNDSSGFTRSYTDIVESATANDPGVRVDQSQLAALPYSSGTTGLPKGVMLTQRMLVCNQLQMITAGRIGPDDVYPIFLPLSHIYGVMLMNLALASGARQILMERFDLGTLVDTVESYGVTLLHLVPPVVLAFANAPDLVASRFRTVRYAMSAAAPLAPALARRVQQRLGFPVVQAYGLTETGPGSHHSPLEPDRIRLESVGTVLADTEQRVVDLETGETIMGPGEVGEILIRGPQVMQGYWNGPDETARALRDGWLHTGDIGYVDEDGYTYLIDRKKEMIKCRAFSIAPAELEAALLEHPDIVDCGVVGAPDEHAGEVPTAFVVLRKGCTLDEAALIEYFSKHLAGYKAIRRWHLVDAIPRTPSGKVLRRVLKERLTS